MCMSRASHDRPLIEPIWYVAALQFKSISGLVMFCKQCSGRRTLVKALTQTLFHTTAEPRLFHKHLPQLHSNLKPGHSGGAENVAVAFLKHQVLRFHKDITQMKIARFLRSQMILIPKITLKLNLGNCRMIYLFQIQSLNFLLYVSLQELVMVELQMAPLSKASGSPQSLENDRDRPSLLAASH